MILLLLVLLLLVLLLIVLLLSVLLPMVLIPILFGDVVRRCGRWLCHLRLSKHEMGE
ncbi:hypothetical protein FA13DRAFT_1734129 [Coprinellus micaceus]|uniref:Uncharacterized protein n=1 Tax=Coprinellus micaceus TaxID=71717 RepID=A0A4Y7T892_COPMI|nr:hypothetical protein FA13DRAFT_1734129 [Coprinellus micaceus]